MVEHKEKITCQICEKVFRSSVRLRIHNRTYHNGIGNKDRNEQTGKKKFKCKYCRFKYFTQNGLDVHIADHGKYIAFGISNFNLSNLLLNSMNFD